MLEAAFWGVASAISLPLGALIALQWQVPARVLGLVMGFGAGALISAVAFELVDEAVAVSGGTGFVGLGLAAGALTFFAGDWYIDRQGGEERKSVAAEQREGNPRAIVLGTVLDGVPESIVIGGSLVVGVGGGVSAALIAATFLSNFPESLAASVGLVESGMSRGRLLGMWAGIVLMSGTAATCGYVLLDNASPNLASFIQTFAAGAMLTMLADTMMPEAFEEGGKPVGLLTVLGFALAAWLSSFE
jgi:ZIP family zinc transporter